MADEWDFFVSYTAADRSWAEWVAWELEEAGHRVLIQAWDMVPGSNWVNSMHEGVQKAKRTIALLSPAYLSSVYGTAEWQAAWHDDPLGEKRKLLVFRVEACERPGLLGSMVSQDLFGLTEDVTRQRLHEAIKGAVTGRAKPSRGPMFPGATRAITAVPEFPGKRRVSPALSSNGSVRYVAGSARPSITELPATANHSQNPRPELTPHRPSQPLPDENASSHRLTILAVATEWASAQGGLSTFNRNLCTALAAAGAQVFSTAPKASEEERRKAAEVGVTLVKPARSQSRSVLDAIARRPELPPGVTPDIVIGHGRITGYAADSLLDHFHNARRVHFIHMAPDEIEWFKPGRDDIGQVAEQRHQEELDLGKGAHRVVAVGPRLFNRYVRDFSSDRAVSVVRMDPGFDMDDPIDRQVPPGAPWSVLLFGRAEDAELKGLDIAARAVALAVRERGPNAVKLELKVRGAPEKSSGLLREQLIEWADDPAMRPLVRSYSTDSVALTNDLHTASLVLVPSRAEGFGLTGVEAIIAGTPTLISAESGLGQLLQEVLDYEVWARFVVPVTGSREADAVVWKNAIAATLRNRQAAFEDAARLRIHLAQRRTWSAAAEMLLKECQRASRDGI